MTAFHHEGDVLVRIPMTWEEYLAHDELVPSEYYGGSLVMVPAPSVRHQHIIGRVYDLIRTHLAPGHTATFGAGWSPDGVQEELIPDLMVHRPTTDRVVRTPPALVVEVLSSNRSDDLVGKMNRYAAWGAPSYWVVDPRDRVVLEYELVEGHFVEIGRHVDGVVTLHYGEAIEVPADLDALFA